MDPKTGEVAATEKPAQVTEQKEVDVKSTPQFKAREEIAQRVEANRQQDQKDMKFDILHEDGTITPADEAVDAVVETELPKEEEKAEAKVEDTKVEQIEPEETRELIVDGKKIQVPLSKILDAGVRTFQKETAADMRLAAASELERQARERLFAPAQAVQQQPLQSSDEDAVLAKAIQFGTEEEAKAAISKLRGSAKATTPQELRDFVNGSLATNIPQHLEFYEANRWVKNEYKEIFADPDLTQVFMNKEVAARNSGDKRPFNDLYKEIAEEMTQKFHLQAPSEQKDQSSDRIVRKAQSPKVASAAAGRSPAPPERKQQTVTDYVQRQRELRGLAPMPRNNQGI